MIECFFGEEGFDQRLADENGVEKDLTRGQLMRMGCNFGQPMVLCKNSGESACHVLIQNSKTHQFCSSYFTSHGFFFLNQ